MGKTTPTPEQLYKTLMLKFVESEQTPPCDGYTDVFYADGVDWVVRQNEREAKIICSLCPFKRECLDYALAAKEPFGVWGGLTVSERNTLLKSISIAHAKPAR